MREIEMEKQQKEIKKVYGSKVIQDMKVKPRKNDFYNNKEKVIDFLKDQWFVTKSRKNILNGRYKLVLMFFHNDEKSQEMPEIVEVSVALKKGEVKDVVVLKDKNNNFTKDKKDIMAAIKGHLIQNNAIEEALNTLN